MTDHGRAVRVADPVHGYVLVTSIERALLDTKPAQRLRYVGQSGLAHLVFPDLRTSRFIHSLGAMHLASRFLAGSLRRAEPEAREAAQDAVKDAVNSVLGAMGNAEVAAGQLEADGLLAADAVDPQYAPYFLLTEQALRLAALFHDLGHLPFSHDFEYALEQLGADPDTDPEQRARPLLTQRPGQDALHERIGHDLSHVLMNDAFADQPHEAARVAFELARNILQVSEAQTAKKIQDTGGLDTPAEGALAWLHTLIAGELDVDRCDYVLRDARSYAFEFAAFDLDRLVDNLTVVRDPAAENTLLPAIRPQAQAAVESFLTARARMYQWGPRHHKVAQVGAALRYATAELLKPALAPQPPHVAAHPLKPFLDDLEAILAFQPQGDVPDGLLDRFAGYDDQWWMEVLRNGPQDDEWFGLVCWRARGPRSLWKRAVDFPDELPAWNAALPERTDVERLRAWDDAVRALRDDGVLVVRHRFAPWKAAVGADPEQEPESALSFHEPEQGLIPVSRVSYPVASLRQAWMHDVQVHAFARSDVAISAEEVLTRLPVTPEGAQQ